MLAGRCLPCHRYRGAWDSRGERPPEGRDLSPPANRSGFARRRRRSCVGRAEVAEGLAGAGPHRNHRRPRLEQGALALGPASRGNNDGSGPELTLHSWHACVTSRAPQPPERRPLLRRRQPGRSGVLGCMTSSSSVGWNGWPQAAAKPVDFGRLLRGFGVILARSHPARIARNAGFPDEHRF
jgi:hypothetical protein